VCDGGRRAWRSGRRTWDDARQGRGADREVYGSTLEWSIARGLRASVIAGIDDLPVPADTPHLGSQAITYIDATFSVPGSRPFLVGPSPRLMLHPAVDPTNGGRRHGRHSLNVPLPGKGDG
jgi:hypothetical protein